MPPPPPPFPRARSQSRPRGLSPGRLFQARRLDGSLLSLGPGIPPSGLLGRQAPSTLPRVGGSENQSWCCAPRLSLGRSARVSQAGSWWKRDNKKYLRLLCVRDRATRRQRQAERGPGSSQARMGMGWPKLRGLPLLCLFSRGCPHPGGEPRSPSQDSLSVILTAACRPSLVCFLQLGNPEGPRLPPQDPHSWLPHRALPIPLCLRLSLSLSRSLSISGSPCLSISGPPSPPLTNFTT